MAHTNNSSRETISLERRRFMIGAAGFTFGIAVGVPALDFATGEAQAAGSAKDLALNPWVTLSTDGTVTIM